MLVNLTAQSPLIGLLAFLAVVGSTSTYLGSIFLRNEPFILRILGGFTINTALLAIFGAILYYITPINPLLLTSLLSAYTLGCAVFSKQVAHHAIKQPPIILALLGLEALFLLPWWKTLSQTVITEAIRSPWDIISPTLLISLALATICTCLIIRLGNRSTSLLAIIPLLFSGISVAAITYPIGLGFDPFIHQATLAHILEHGSISPKPLYYIGQYALELFLSGVFQLPLTLVDHWLIPVLTAIILPTSFLIGVSRAFTVKHSGFLLALFLIPLAPFIISTPQSLAYLFTAASLFFCLPILAKESKSLTVPGLFALAAIITHPLAGIPAVLFFCITAMSRIEHQATRVIFTTLSLIFSSISLPLVFLFQAKTSSLSFTWDPSNLFTFTSWQPIGFDTWLSFINLMDIAFPILLTLLAIAGTYAALKTHAPKPWHLPLLAAISWMMNYTILRGMKFDFLIEYEQGNYAERLLILAALFCLPAIATAVAWFWNHAKQYAGIMQAGILAFTLIFISGIYLAYPRNDGTVRSAGFNVSQTDIDAAHAIAAHGDETNYVVLANQAVSAAALREFGFVRYYENDLFYYPIPTSSPLYDQFLLMADEEPTKEIAEEVLRQTGADRMYFVLNDYWWNAEATAEAAKKIANEWFAIGDGTILIFVFE